MRNLTGKATSRPLHQGSLVGALALYNEVDLGKLHQANGALQFGHAVIETRADRRFFAPAQSLAVLMAMVMGAARLDEEVLAVGDDHAALAGVQCLAGVGGESADVAKRAGILALVAGAHAS